MISSTGTMSQPFLLRQLIAGSARFQALTGTTSVGAALERTHYPEAVDEDQDVSVASHPRPRAIVLTDGQWERRQVGRQSWTTNATLAFIIELLVPKGELEQGEAGAFHWADTELGTITDEMLDNSGLGQPDSSVNETYLSVQAIRKTEGPWINPSGEYDLVDPSGSRQEQTVAWSAFEVEVF